MLLLKHFKFFLLISLLSRTAMVLHNKSEAHVKANISFIFAPSPWSQTSQSIGILRIKSVKESNWHLLVNICALHRLKNRIVHNSLQIIEEIALKSNPSPCKILRTKYGRLYPYPLRQLFGPQYCPTKNIQEISSVMGKKVTWSAVIFEPTIILRMNLNSSRVI